MSIRPRVRDFRRARAAAVTRGGRALSRRERVLSGLALPGLRLQLGKPAGGLLDVGGEIPELLHLADFDHLVSRGGETPPPFNPPLLPLHLGHSPAPPNH